MKQENNTYRVWHVPQVPGKTFFVVATSAEEAVRIRDILAEYDKFQYENKIKPDYVNFSGIDVANTDTETGETEWWRADWKVMEALGMLSDKWLEANPVDYSTDND